MDCEYDDNDDDYDDQKTNGQMAVHVYMGKSYILTANWPQMFVRCHHHWIIIFLDIFWNFNFVIDLLRKKIPKNIHREPLINTKPDFLALTHESFFLIYNF